MATETPSKEYRFVLVGEDHPAFRTERAAKRDIKKRWAAQEPAERKAYYLATVVKFLEPEYDFDVAETDIESGATTTETTKKTE